jgi:hypothetical protein
MFLKYTFFLVLCQVLIKRYLFTRPGTHNLRRKPLQMALQRLAHARLIVCVARTAEGGEAVTDLLRLQKKYFIYHFFVFQK